MDLIGHARVSQPTDLRLPRHTRRGRGAKSPYAAFGLTCGSSTTWARNERALSTAASKSSTSNHNKTPCPHGAASALTRSGDALRPTHGAEGSGDRHRASHCMCPDAHAPGVRWFPANAGTSGCWPLRHARQSEAETEPLHFAAPCPSFLSPCRWFPIADRPASTVASRSSRR